MSNKKQTAVEWLESEMLKPNLSMHEIINQAKELEKQQIIDAYRKSTYQFSVDAQMDCPKSAEQYYTETYE